jgi:hypothetical protein
MLDVLSQPLIVCDGEDVLVGSWFQAKLHTLEDVWFNAFSESSRCPVVEIGDVVARTMTKDHDPQF